MSAIKHVNTFLNPDANETIELTKIPNPMTCCPVARSKIFLMMWLIFNLLKTKRKHAKADMITNIPNAIGMKRNVTPIFAKDVNRI